MKSNKNIIKCCSSNDIKHCDCLYEFTKMIIDKRS